MGPWTPTCWSPSPGWLSRWTTRTPPLPRWSNTCASPRTATPGSRRPLDTYLELVPEPVANETAQITMPSMGDLVNHCVPPEVPAIVDARSATMNEMVENQTAVRSFMAASEEHLECLAEVIDAQDLAREERAYLTSVHNRVVDAMEAVAGDFNDQVRLFRDRE